MDNNGAYVLDAVKLEGMVRECHKGICVENGTEERIFWAEEEENAVRAVTKLAVVYIHGFSASRQENDSLVQALRTRFKANVFCARLPGHGGKSETGHELRDDASMEKYFEAALDAAYLGLELGEKIILVGSSTGGVLCTWLAAQPSIRPRVDSLILLSPAYCLASSAYPVLSRLLYYTKVLLPKDLANRIRTWIVETAVGPTRIIAPKNRRHQTFWTLTYPSPAIIHLVETLMIVDLQDIQEVTCPALIVGCPTDHAVSWKYTLQKYTESSRSAPTVLVVLNAGEGGESHVLCSDVLSPSTVPGVIAQSLAFVETYSSLSSSSRKMMADGPKSD